MKRAIIIVLVCVCLVGFGVSGYRVYSTLQMTRQGQESYKNLTDSYVTKHESAPAASGTAEASQAEQPGGEGPKQEEEKEKWVPPLTVDFDELLKANSDVIGWIYSEGTTIDFPVVQGEDNEYYLRHLLDGTYHRYGTVFEDALNTRGIVDGDTILYGHHMVDGAMFAEIIKYAGQEYYTAHPVMWLLTPGQDYQVQLFAAYVTTNGDPDTYQIFPDADQQLLDYALERKEKSDFKCDVVPALGDRLLMLSTCEYSDYNTRYVVFGILRPC